ncbi:MAG: hypothetical protein RLY24_694, partial [Actinomycetota bacterium]
MSRHHIVLRGAHVVNPDAVSVADVGVTDGVISAVGTGL